MMHYTNATMSDKHDSLSLSYSQIKPYYILFTRTVSLLLNHTQMRGCLIVFEGIDRSGKTTQARTLLQELRAQGLKCEYISFPGTYISIDPNTCTFVSDENIHLLFSKNRWELSAKITALVSDGTHVILDRYVFSGIAYSTAKGLPLEWCKAPDTGLPAPDCVLFMNIDPKETSTRGGYGEEVYETLEFQAKVIVLYMCFTVTL
jgi:dTMP kinase